MAKTRIRSDAVSQAACPPACFDTSESVACELRRFTRVLFAPTFTSTNAPECAPNVADSTCVSLSRPTICASSSRVRVTTTLIVVFEPLPPARAVTSRS